jgi:parallel beta-helix repeat protein
LTTPAAAVTVTVVPARAGSIGQQITVAVNTAFNTLFTGLGGLPGNPISGLLEGALVLVRRTVFGLVPTGVTAAVDGTTLVINVDPGSTAYFRQNGTSLQVSGDPVFFHLLNAQQFEATSVQTVTATNTGTGHAGLVFASGDVNASLETAGIDSLNFGADAQFEGSVNVDAKDSGTLVLYNAVRGLTGVTLDAPAIRLATNVDVEAASLTGTAPDVTFTGTVDATTPGAQSLSVTALGATTFAGAVGSQVALGSLLTRGIAPLSIPQSADSQTIPLYYMPEYSPSNPGGVKTGIPVAIGNNAPLFYTFDTGGSAFAAGYSQAFWSGVPPVGPGPVGFEYGNGNYLNGVAVTTPITLGSGANSLTTGPIQLGAGTSGGNTESHQTYDFSNPDAGPLNGRFFGDFGAGFKQKPVPGQQQQMASAMFQLPGSLSSGFLVQLGPIGTQGWLTLGAPQALLGQFHYAVKVAEMPGTPDYPGTFDAALQQFGVFGTYVATVDGTKYTLDDKPIATLFDTGGGSTHFVGAPGAPPVDHLKTGDTLTATFENALTGPDGQPGPKLEWTLGAGQQQSVDYVYFVDDKTAEPRPNVNTGLDLFNAFDVLFDYQDRLVYLRPNGGQSTVILHSSVNTTGAQSYQQGNVTLNGTYTTQGGAVSVAGTATLAGDTQITTGSGAVTFSGTIDGATDHPAAAPSLTVNTTDATTFVRAVGWVHPLSSLTTTSGAATATSSVSTTGSQSYGGDVTLSGPYWVYDKDSAFTVAGATTLAGPVSVNACGAAGAPERKCADTGASITFNGTVDSLANKGFPLTVVAGATGHVIFNGAVGATNPLGGLAITNADTVTARGTVSLDGGLGYSAAKGLQIGSNGPFLDLAHDSGYVRVANFTAGGSVQGFQKDGGSNFAVTNGANGVGCDHDKDTAGACGSGVVVEGGSQLTIQGFAIANNASDGVLLADGTGVTVTGNTIFNNTVDGVGVTAVSANTSTNNVISSNTIYGNSRNGVHVSGSGTIGNAILSNSIYSNNEWGIHLIDGGNDGQQPPESVTAQRQEKSITVSGNLAGDRKGLFQVQVFGNTVKDQQGAQLLGSGNFAVGAFTITVPEGTWASGTTTHVTVTATPVDGPQNTSEFSTAAQVD